MRRVEKQSEIGLLEILLLLVAAVAAALSAVFFVTVPSYSRGHIVESRGWVSHSFEGPKGKIEKTRVGPFQCDDSKEKALMVERVLYLLGFTDEGRGKVGRVRNLCRGDCPAGTQLKPFAFLYENKNKSRPVRISLTKDEKSQDCSYAISLRGSGEVLLNAGTEEENFCGCFEPF